MKYFGEVMPAYEKYRARLKKYVVNTGPEMGGILLIFLCHINLKSRCSKVWARH